MAFARPSSLGSNRWSCSELADGSNHLMASKLEAGGGDSKEILAYQIKVLGEGYKT